MLSCAVFALVGIPPAIAQQSNLRFEDLQSIERADLDKIPSGCSFLLRDKANNIVMISTSVTDRNVSFWIKTAGKLSQALGKAVKTKEPGFINFWNGKSGKTLMHMQKLTVEGNRNKPGEDSLFHGKATIEFRTGAAAQKITASWEAGC